MMISSARMEPQYAAPPGFALRANPQARDNRVGYHALVNPPGGPGITWFVPFALLLAIITLPLALYSPLLAAPFILAAAGVAAGVWHAERPPDLWGAVLLVQVVILAGLGTVLLAIGLT